MGLGFEI